MTLSKSLIAVGLVFFSLPLSAKDHSALFPDSLVARARTNCDRSEWAAGVRKQIVEAARPFRERSDEELWGLMFGNTLPRSWMVWSDGHCPNCKEPVPMYNWKMDALAHPWKVQ
ncbi:MAG: hypothetical protein IT195_13545, partial [Microthrixaceae bacterium]|nr:hypothetical protein [Microthrixaceae bacterium]